MFWIEFWVLTGRTYLGEWDPRICSTTTPSTTPTSGYQRNCRPSSFRPWISTMPVQPFWSTSGPRRQTARFSASRLFVQNGRTSPMAVGYLAKSRPHSMLLSGVSRT